MTLKKTDVSDLSLARKIVFSGVAGFLLLGMIEMGLWVLDVPRGEPIETTEFTFPMEDWKSPEGVALLERHPQLFWKPKAYLYGHNSRGIYGPEFEDRKAPGTTRLVSLGDSCTHFGPGPYPERLQGLLDEKESGRFEVINAAVVGWTSYQGLVRLRDEVATWEPDLVTVYFGWNDHWRALGLADRLQPIRSEWRVTLAQRLGHLRIVRSLSSLRQRAPRGGFRVELADYSENLREMKREADRAGTEIWFLTAPHALDLGIPRFLIESGDVDDPESLVELHRGYNKAMRDVARQVGVRLIDLERELDALPKQELFERDHIHLSESGRTYVAERLFAEMLESGLFFPG